MTIIICHAVRKHVGRIINIRKDNIIYARKGRFYIGRLCSSILNHTTWTGDMKWHMKYGLQSYTESVAPKQQIWSYTVCICLKILLRMTLHISQQFRPGLDCINTQADLKLYCQHIPWWLIPVTTQFKLWTAYIYTFIMHSKQIYDWRLQFTVL